MHDKKWKHHRLSKQLYPTTIVRSGQGKGHMQFGRELARKALRAMLGRDVSHMRETDTRGEWVFSEPL